MEWKGDQSLRAGGGCGSSCFLKQNAKVMNERARIQKYEPRIEKIPLFTKCLQLA